MLYHLDENKFLLEVSQVIVVGTQGRQIWKMVCLLILLSLVALLKIQLCY